MKSIKIIVLLITSCVPHIMQAADKTPAKDMEMLASRNQSTAELSGSLAFSFACRRFGLRSYGGQPCCYFVVPWFIRKPGIE